MVDSIFDRPMFGTPGTSEDIDKQIDRAGRAPEKNEITNKFPQYSYDQIYDDSFMPFDKEGIATLMQTYTAPDAIRGAYEEYAGKPKSAQQFASEYDALTPDVADPDTNFKSIELTIQLRHELMRALGPSLTSSSELGAFYLG